MENNWRHVNCFAHTLSLAVKDAIHKNVAFAGKNKNLLSGAKSKSF